MPTTERFRSTPAHVTSIPPLTVVTTAMQVSKVENVSQKPCVAQVNNRIATPRDSRLRAYMSSMSAVPEDQAKSILTAAEPTLPPPQPQSMLTGSGFNPFLDEDAGRMLACLKRETTH